MESLLSLRGQAQEWRPLSPAASVTGDPQSSPPRVVREEVVDSMESERRIDEGEVSETSQNGVPRIVSMFTYVIYNNFTPNYCVT